MPFESNLAANGITTVPKALRTALGLDFGGRMVWEMTPSGELVGRLKYAYRHRSASSESRKPPTQTLPVG